MLSGPCSAQQYPNPGFPPFSTQAGGNYDSIDLAVDNISISIPLRNKSGPVPFTSNLFGASNAYLFDWNPEAPLTSTGWIITPPLFNAVTNALTRLSFTITNPTTCNGQADTYYTGFAVIDANGTSHLLGGNLIIDSLGCYPIPGPATTIDGSGYTMVFTGRPSGTLYDKYGNHFPSGGGITNPDGVSLSVTGAATTTYSDALSGTPILAATPFGTIGQPATNVYTDAGGNARQFDVNWGGYTWVTNFGCPNVTEYGPFMKSGKPATNYFPSTITAPDGGVYTITYETTPNYSNPTYPPPYVTGRIAKIALPSGGSISYTYAGGSNGINCANGTVPTLTRTENDGAGHTASWTYVNSRTGSSNYPNFTVTETDPAANQTVHYFQGEIQTQVMAYEGGCPTSVTGCSGGGTLLRTVTICYNGNFTNCVAPSTLIGFPVTQKDVYSSYNGSSNNLLETKYDSYGNVSEVRQYDFGAAMPPSGNPLSDTVYSYGQSWNGTACTAYPSGTYIFGTPCYIHTKNSAGTDVAKTQITYGNTGHAISTAKWVAGSSWLTSTATYNSNGTIATATDVNGALSTYAYTGTGGCNSLLPTSVTVTGSGLTSGLQTATQWDCNGGVVIANTDSNGEKTNTNYEAGSVGDPFYRPVSTVDPLGKTTAFDYTANSTESAFNFNGSTSTVDSLKTQDGLLRPVNTQTRQGQGSATFDSTQTAYGWTTTTTTSPGGAFTTRSMPYSAGAGGQAPSGTAVTKTQYDALRRPLTVTDGGGGTVTYTYTKNDQLQVTGPAPSGENTKQRQYEYDGLGRLTSVCEITSATGSGAGSCAQTNSATGFLTKYTYDPLGNLLTVVENAQPGEVGGQQTRTYTYDGLSRLLTESNPESNGGTIHYTYDVSCGGLPASAGDLTESMDAASNVTCYSYDALHRKTAATYPSGPYSTRTPPKTYVYDTSGFACSNPNGAYVKGRLAEAYTGPSSAKITDIGYCYSYRGEVTDVFESTPHSGGYYHTGTGYFGNGALNTLSGIPTISTWTYNVDGEGRPYSATYGSSTNWVTSTTYSPSNSSNPPSSTVTFGNGSPGDSDLYGYDPNTGRTTKFQFTVGATPKTFTGTLTWNADGTLGSLGIADQFTSANNQTCSYAHDDLSRARTVNCLNGSTNVWNQTFALDAFGNVSKSGTISFAANYLLANGTTTNQEQSVGTCTPTYDANGNLTKDCTFTTPATYTWDADANPTALNTVNVTYDALDREVEFGTGSAYTQVLYGPIGKLGLMNGQTVTSIRIPLPGGSTAEMVGPSGATTRILHADWLGSTRLSTSYAGRTVAYDTAYAPYGESYNGTSSDLNFTGQRQDTFAGLYDFLYRGYNPIHGRWISPDPAGLGPVDVSNPQNWNRYAYVKNSPLSLTDPNGLDAAECSDSSNTAICQGGYFFGESLSFDFTSGFDFTITLDDLDSTPGTPDVIWPSDDPPVIGPPDPPSPTPTMNPKPPQPKLDAPCQLTLGKPCQPPMRPEQPITPVPPRTQPTPPVLGQPPVDCSSSAAREARPVVKNLATTNGSNLIGNGLKPSSPEGAAQPTCTAARSPQSQ